MLQIRIANIPVYVDHDLSLVLTSPYPGMAAGQQGGNFVFNFKVAATDDLKRAIGFVHRPGTSSNTRVPFSINASGIRWDGLAEITEAGRDYYEIMCPLGNGDFNSRAKDVRLPQLDYGGDLSLPLASCVGRTTVDLNYDLYGESQFSVESVLVFSDIQNNTGELSPNGELYVANAGKTINLKFEVFALIDASYRAIRIYKNNSVFRDLLLTGNNERVSTNIDVEPGDELYFRLYLESLGGIHNTITGSFFKNSKLTIADRQLSSTMLDGAIKRYPDINYAVFPVHNPFAFDHWPDDEFQIDNQSLKTIYSRFVRVMNYWFNNAFPGTIAVEGEDETMFYAGNLFVPFPYIAFIVQRIADRFGLRIINNVFENELKYAVLINHYLENYFLDERMLAANNKLLINDHVPDWSVYDFMQELCKFFGLGYEIDNEASTIEFMFLKDLLTTKPIDISHLVVSHPVADWNNNPSAMALRVEYPNECKLNSDIKSQAGLKILGAVNTLSELPATADVNDAYLVLLYDSYYAWNYNPDTYEFSWVFHSRRYVTEITTGENPFEITSKLASALNIRYVDIIQPISLFREWQIPASHQVAEFEGAPDIYNGNWHPVVCWYHGMYNDSLGQPYPFASADVSSFSGNDIPDAPFSLHLGGSRGRYNILWRDYITWRQSAKPVRIQFIPDNKFLKEFRFCKQVSFSGVNYLVAEIRGSIGNNGHGVWEMLALVV